ncbi:LysR family transcriptional regulator [Myxococcota bacterium]|nr:LysR family transcriptional regulator [Myxococcota bacterium]
MQVIDLAAADLNLLVVLDVLLEERNVTRAARRLHRTQSATSHALARLRDMLGDPILVRVGSEMRPTPRAERLGPEVSRLLKTIGRVLGEESVFDPKTSDRVFTIAAPDFVAAALPSLVERMSVDARGVSLELVPVGRSTFRDVADGRFDLAITPPRRDDALRSVALVSLDWAVYAREGHPAIDAWGPRAWAEHAHVRIRTSSDAESPVDRAARAKKLTRKRGPVLPHFLLAPPLLARTDLLMTVPRAVLADVAPRFGLVALPCPVKLPPIELALAWSAQLDRDPANAWFRGLVGDVVAQVLAPPRRRAAR